MSFNIEREYGNYSIKFAQQSDEDIGEIIIRSRRGAGYSAKHNKYFRIDSSGNILSTESIDKSIAGKIINNIILRGETEGFYLCIDGEGSVIDDTSDIDKKNLSDLRHQMSDKETNYTSTGEKLIHHYPIFNKLKETGYGSIVRATMTLHQVCSSRCQYCSTISRNKRDSISLDDAKRFVDELYFKQPKYNLKYFSDFNSEYKELTGTDIRLRGLILSGGGQPNLWPHFTEFVEWLVRETDIELGLITNGFPRNVQDKIYENFRWIRISITPENASPHYIDGKFNRQYIPDNIKNNKDVTLGFSYVYGPWTNDDILVRIFNSVEELGADYCRMLTDCNLSRSLQIEAHKSLEDKLISLGMIDDDGMPSKKIFHQLKYHGTEKEANSIWTEGLCYLQSYNVFWDTTDHEAKGESFCYACDSITVLAESSNSSHIIPERKFNSDIWGTVTNRNVDLLYKEPLQRFFDPREVCKSCLFMQNNQQVKNIMSASRKIQVGDVPGDIQHVCFP